MSLRVGNYIIENDQYGLSVYEERKKKLRKGQEAKGDEDTIVLIGYYSNLANCGAKILDAMAADAVAESRSMKAIVEILKEGREELKREFSKVRKVCDSSD